MKTLAQALSAAALKNPKAIAVLQPDGSSISYGDLYKRSLRASYLLEELGAGKRDCIGLICKNSFNAIAAYFGILQCGARVLWVNHTLDTQEQQNQLSDAGAKAVFIDDVRKHNSPKAIDIAAVESDGGRWDAPLSGITEDDLAAIVYTSGSTNKPLGVMLTHRNLLSNNVAIAKYLKLSESDRVCCVLPLYYIYGISLLLSHFIAGGSVLLENRFSFPQTALDAMGKYEVTGFSGVSSHYIILLNQTNFSTKPLERLRYFTHAGDKMPPAVVEKLVSHFPGKEIYLMYGQTEAAPRVSYLEPSRVKEKPTSVGRAIAEDVEIRIVDEAGKVCGALEHGEITVKGPNIMRGYWNSPVETSLVLKDGWLHTGDMGYKDEEGDLYVIGRKKQFLKIGGNRVNPIEIETVSLEHKGVKEAAAIGIEDPTWGQALKVFIAELSAGAVNKDELMDFYKKRLPVFKIPAQVEILGALPRNSQGKIDKKILEARP